MKHLAQMKELHELSRAELLDWAVAEMKLTRRGRDEPTEEEIQALRQWAAKAADDFDTGPPGIDSVIGWCCLIMVWNGEMILDWDRNRGDTLFTKFGNVPPDTLDRGRCAN